MTDLCDVTGLSEASGCDPAISDNEDVIVNPPAQSTLRYRLGTFATFRRALLAALPERLPQWTERSRHDYGVVLLEMWATLADILTFYQERIANESFLRPAVLRESVVRLAALVDYRLNPGVAANVYLAFTGEKGKTLELPQGFRAQTKPERGRAPVPFETDEPLTVYASLNRLRVQSLQDQSLGLGDRDAVVQGVKTNLKPGDHLLILGQERRTDPGSERWELRQVSQVIPAKLANTTRVVWQEPLGHNLPHVQVEPSARPQLYALRLQAELFGHDAPDYKSLVSSTVVKTPAKAGPVTTLVDAKSGNTTTTYTITTNIPAPEKRTVVTKGPNSTTTVTTETIGTEIVETTTTTPNVPDWTNKKLPEDIQIQHRNHIFLDDLYPAITADSWIALVTRQPVDLTPGGPVITHPQGYAEVYRVEKVDETSYANYTLTAKVTLLTVDTVEQRYPAFDETGQLIPGPWTADRQPENIHGFPLRGTSVLAHSELLLLARVPVAAPVAGDQLTLDSVYPDLQPGRRLILVGRAPGGTETQTEVVQVKNVALSNTQTETIVTLTASLRYAYDPTTLILYGNVAVASQGETIAGEILGSGDAAQPFQSFTLKKSPLTFLRAAGPDANRWGTQAALHVRVDGVLWNEKDQLLDSRPADRDYTLAVDADDRATLTFGGGAGEQPSSDSLADSGKPVEGSGQKVRGGARLPSGRDNVRVHYRHGLGAKGNVAAGTVSTPVNSAPGLKSVTNPLGGTGGADREREDEVKANLPGALRAFDRAVSLEDYAALARTYSGVAKARAAWQVIDPTDPAGPRLNQARIQLTVATTDHTPPLQPVFKAALRAFLDARRDSNQPLVIADYQPVSVDLNIAIEPEPDRLPERVLDEVAAALSAVRNPDGHYGLFAFERLDFGLSLHLSDIYAAVQAVPGVRAALVICFRRTSPNPSAEEFDRCREAERHLFIRSTEILRCDNDPADRTRGILNLTIGKITHDA